MSKLSRKQALFLWRMITGPTPDVQEPKWSEAKPKIGKERQLLVDEGYLTKEKRGKADHLLLTDKAWSWAQDATNVEVLKSRSTVGAEALEGLLHRLLPYLKAQEIPLAALFMPSTPAPSESISADEATTPPNSPESSSHARDLAAKIEHACLSIAGGRRKVRILLRDLRPALSEIPRRELDETLISMNRARRLVLYPEDNTAALTPEDHAAALLINDSPRHLVYLEEQAWTTR